MREINSKEYATEVEDYICNEVEMCLFEACNHLAAKYGFSRPGAEKFSAAFYEEDWATVRDFAIRLFETVGMDIFPDGRSF